MLLRSVDVLDIYVEPFILRGFRLPNQPYSYYYRSLFSFHNETISIWIHLIGIVILIKQLIEHMNEISSFQLKIYLIYNCFGGCVMLLCSVQAHLFHSRTISDHIRSFYFDYFGINFYGFTSAIVLRRFSHQLFLMNDNQYICILIFLTIYSISIECFCKYFFCRPYPKSHQILQCSGVFLVYFYQIIPILKANLFFPTNAHYWHLIQFVSFISSGLIFLGRIPERFYPGLFDCFGQSHHTFHLTIFLVTYSQSKAVFYDMHRISFDIVQSILIKDICSTLIVLVLHLLTIQIWYNRSRPIVEQRYSKLHR